MASSRHHHATDTLNEPMHHHGADDIARRQSVSALQSALVTVLQGTQTPGLSAMVDHLPAGWLPDGPDLPTPELALLKFGTQHLASPLVGTFTAIDPADLARIFYRGSRSWRRSRCV